MTRKTALLIGAISLILTIPAAAQKPDAPGCKDPSLFPNRIPNYRIEKCETKPFDFFEFYTVKPPKRRVEGQLTFVAYTVDRKEDARSKLEIVRNYENALKKIGGRIEGSNQNWWVNGTVTVGGKLVWAQAEAGNGKIWLRIVQEQGMSRRSSPMPLPFRRI